MQVRKAKSEKSLVPGWIMERSSLHAEVQSLKEQLFEERRLSNDSQSSAQLALAALQEELQMDREKLKTKLTLQRAYLQAELTTQDTQRGKAEQALEVLRKRWMDRLFNPRLKRKAFRGWARAFRETAEAVSMLSQAPPDSPRRLRFLIEDAERDSFSRQFEQWLQEDEDSDDPRTEQEQIIDTRSLLKDQAKEAISTMTKAMEDANASRQSLERDCGW
ncbi:unnamed protein product [Effrenium voratum]|uniref:Uncharacterized protein n=1 Tax=Effrenium voratum TaxID=2562239 RepID=A0AA36IM56_9DINO|nr:unnamed protein product [Effrenium voratum]